MTVKDSHLHQFTNMTLVYIFQVLEVLSSGLCHIYVCMYVYLLCVFVVFSFLQVLVFASTGCPKIKPVAHCCRLLAIFFWDIKYNLKGEIDQIEK